MYFQMSSAPAWTLKGKPNAKKREEVPGPGSYKSSNITLDSSPQVHFGSVARPEFHLASKNTPGPGAYSQVVNSSGPSFSLSSRDRKKLKDTVPGPGAYDDRSRSTKERPSSAFVGSEARALKLVDNQTSKQPGPGSYGDISFRTQKAYTGFGSAQRPDFAKAKGKDAPGPGTYSVVLQAATTTFFGSEKKKEKVNPGPGPGTYNNPSAFEKSTGWTIRGRKKQQKKDSVPGPGSYCPEGMSNGPRWKFTSEGRYKKNRDSNPGPGAYAIKNTIGDLPAYAR